MAATVEIDELNLTQVRTHGVSNLNVGSVDAPNIVVTPLTAVRIGQNAYTKYNQLHFISLGQAATVQNLRVWKSLGAPLVSTGEKIQTNLHHTTYDYQWVDFAVPSVDTYVRNTMPETEPPNANLGVNHDLYGTLTAPGYSDIWKWQLQLSPTARPGALSSKEFTFSWDEA